MNENVNPELNSEELEASVGDPAEETTETVTEESAEPAEVTEEVTEVAEEAVAEAKTDADEEADTVEAQAESDEDTETTGAEAEAEEKPAKKRLLQIPVIISICIVAVALISYLVFIAFFLRVPEGLIWSTELDGATYYFEFKDDNSFKAYVGSVEIDSQYQKDTDEEGNDTLTIGTSVANFYNGAPAAYTITGSRLLGNQVLSYSYGEGYDFEVTQASRKETAIELPENFEPDEALLGDWVFQYYGYDIYKVTFNDDGTIKLQFVQDGITYNGTYTIEDGQINFTYYVADSVAAPLEYSIDGDTLSFLGATFVRPDSAATPDQVLQIPQE